MQVSCFVSCWLCLCFVVVGCFCCLLFLLFRKLLTVLFCGFKGVLVVQLCLNFVVWDCRPLVVFCECTFFACVCVCVCVVGLLVLLYYNFLFSSCDLTRICFPFVKCMLCCVLLCSLLFYSCDELPWPYL